MKKIIPVLLIILILSSVLLGWKFLLKKKPAGEVEEELKPRIEAINQLPLQQRPYITIEPKSETKPQDYGHWITVTIANASNYKKVEYEVEYQAGNLIQGFMHRIDFAKESFPVSKEGFFGSESKGKYKYDEDVRSGHILFKFFKDNLNYDALKTYFNIQNMAEQKGLFTSNDGKASLEVGNKDLNGGDYIVVASTLGLPSQTEGRIVSEPYGFYGNRSVALNNATLTIKSKENLTGAKILGWDGKKWQEYQVKQQEDSFSVKVNYLGTFVLVAD